MKLKHDESALYKFDIVIYKKDKIFETPESIEVIDDDYGQIELENKMTAYLEKAVIDNGLLTTYSGIHILAFRPNHGKAVALLIIYKPTLNYISIADTRQMRKELEFLGSKVKV